jgi:phosphoglycerate kinase
MKPLKMTDLALEGKRVMIRQDLNVPLKGGVVTSDARIRAALPTIKAALDQGAAVILLSHLGRPKEGKFDVLFSLAPVAEHLAALLGREVHLVSDWLDGITVWAGVFVFC